MKKRILYSMLGAVIATALVFTFVVQLVQMSFLRRLSWRLSCLVTRK